MHYRVKDHPILDVQCTDAKIVQIEVDGEKVTAREGEPIAAALLAHGIRVMRRTAKLDQPRGVYCAIGQCTDCAMTVDGVPNVRTCITPVRAGMKVETQSGVGTWKAGS